MQQITIRMPEKIFSKIEQIAKLSGLKKTDITRMAIRKFPEEYSSEEGAALYSKAKLQYHTLKSAKAPHLKYLADDLASTGFDTAAYEPSMRFWILPISANVLPDATVLLAVTGPPAA